MKRPNQERVEKELSRKTRLNDQRPGKQKELESVVYFGGIISKKLCPICKTVIAELVPYGDPVDGIQQVVFSHNASYKVVTLTFDDGSAHQSVTCKKCAPRTMEEAESLYISDLYEWNREIEKVPSKKLPDDLYRRVIEIIEV